MQRPLLSALWLSGFLLSQCQSKDTSPTEVSSPFYNLVTWQSQFNKWSAVKNWNIEKQIKTSDGRWEKDTIQMPDGKEEFDFILKSNLDRPAYIGKYAISNPNGDQTFMYRAIDNDLEEKEQYIGKTLGIGFADSISGVKYTQNPFYFVKKKFGFRIKKTNDSTFAVQYQTQFVQKIWGMDTFKLEVKANWIEK